MDGVSTTPSFEHDRRLRAGFVGCGDHSFRNVYPALRYHALERQGYQVIGAPALWGPSLTTAGQGRSGIGKLNPR